MKLYDAEIICIMEPGSIHAAFAKCPYMICEIKNYSIFKRRVRVEIKYKPGYRHHDKIILHRYKPHPFITKFDIWTKESF